jgi:hypothetical protein
MYVQRGPTSRRRRRRDAESVAVGVSAEARTNELLLDF